MKKKKKSPGRRYGVSAAQFVKIWTQAKTIDEVIKATGLPRNAVYSRVNAYRAKDIKLKKMPRTQTRANGIDVVALNKLIEETKKEG